MLPALTLVLGGASSGKSAYAEGLIRQSGLKPVYLATSRAEDDEMRARIARHRDMRGTGWRTIEEPMAPETRLGDLDAGHAVLLDCATLWLSNRMLAGEDWRMAQTGLIEGLAGTPAPVIVVSNELGLSVVPENRLARQFRDAQGQLNQALAARADLAVLVTAGLPQTLKGTPP